MTHLPIPKTINVTRFIWVLALIWTLLVAGLLAWNLWQARQATYQTALAQARANFNKDQAFRFWATAHGGVYVPIDADTPPNPFLSHVPERDIETPAGQKLTLMNPAYMVRQMNENFADLYGIAGRITSLKPLRPENAPDGWERAALEAFEQGQTEMLEFTDIDGAPTLRLMQPIVTQPGCLKCHGQQGYQVGDVRGGIAVALPLAPLLATEQQVNHTKTLSLGLLWLVGVIGLVMAGRDLNRRIQERDVAIASEQAQHIKLQAIVAALPDLIMRYDRHGVTLEVIGAQQVETVAPLAQLVGSKPDDWLPAHLAEQRLYHIQQALAHNQMQVYDYEIWLSGVPHREEARLVPTAAGEVIVIIRDITERKLIEAALVASERKFRSIVEQSADAIVLTDETGQIVEWNRAAEQLFGLPRTEVLGQMLWDAQFRFGVPGSQPPGWYDQLKAAITNALQTGQGPMLNRLTETPIQHPDGRQPVIQSLVFAIESEPGYFLGSINRDITERKRIEQALRENEARFRLLFDSAPDAVFIANIETGLIVDANVAATHLLARPKADIVGTHFAGLHPAETTAASQEKFVRHIRELETTGVASPMEHMALRSDGRVVPIEVTARAIELQGQKFLMGNFRDISERKRVEAALQASEARYRQIFETNMAVKLVIDPSDGQIVDANQAACRFYGYDLETLTGMRITDINILSEAEVRQEMNQAVGEERLYFDFRHRLASGEIRDVEVYSGPVQSGDKTLLYSIVHDVTARMQAEARLREREENFRTLFNTINDFLFILDAQGRILEVNQTVIRRLGYSLADLRQQPVLMVHPAERHEEAAHIIAEMLQGRQDYCPVPLIRKDGQLIPVETYVTPGVWNGQPALFGISKDVSALRLSEEKFAAAFHQSPVMVGLSDLETGAYVEVNQTFCHKLGVTPAEVIGQKATDILRLDPDFRTRKISWLKQHGAIRNEEIVIYTKDGIPLTVLLSAQVIDLHDRRYNFTTALDITERKQAEMALAGSKNRLELVLHGANLGMWDWNIQTGSVVFNERWAEIVGRTLADIEPNVSSWEKLIHPADMTAVMDALTAHMEGRAPFYRTEHRLRHKSGQWVWVYDAGKVYERDSTGAPLRAAGIHLDITDHKAMEESLRQARDAAEAANRAKSAFLSNMSHELRTPLNGILGYTQIFKRDAALTAKQQAGIDIIHRSGEHLLTMINDILDLSKIEANRMELLLAEFDFGQFLRVIVEMSRVRAEHKGLALNFYPASNLPTSLLADETRLRQILLNLLGNAIKFTPQGSVTFSVRVTDRVNDAGGKLKDEMTSLQPSAFSLVTFEVKDTGLGIDPAQRAEIFEPFHQVGDRRGKASGTGLGLSISQTLVRMMGGELHIDSVAPDWQAGSRFWFEIPLQVTHDRPRIDILDNRCVRGYTAPADKTPLKLLLVDDSPENRTALRDFLAPLGFEISEAGNGLEAVAQASRWNPDLIFMDLVMPELDGLEATRQIRAQPHLRDVPIIAISASVSDRTRQKSLLASCDDFLPKPFEAAQVLEKLQRLLPLVWVDDDSFDLPARPAAQLLVLPPAAELAALLKLAMVGDVTGLEKRVSDLRQQNEQYAAFAAQLSGLAAEFRLDELEQYIRDSLEGR